MLAWPLAQQWISCDGSGVAGLFPCVPVLHTLSDGVASVCSFLLYKDCLCL